MYVIYLFTQGRGEGVGEQTREKAREATVYKAGKKYHHDGLCLQCINYLTPAKTKMRVWCLRVI
jgi:hypothetical protein